MQPSDNASKLEKSKLLAFKAWGAIGICILLIFLVNVLGMIWPAVSLLLVGLILGFICSPITNFLERHKVGRAAGAFVALIVVMASIVAIFAFLAPPFIDQLVDLLRRVPYFFMASRDAINNFLEQNKDLLDAQTQNIFYQYLYSFQTLGVQASTSLLTTLSNGLIDNLMSLTGGLFTLFLGLVLAYWLAKDYPKIARELRVIAGPEHEGDLSVMLAVMSRATGGYMRGIVITSFVGGFLSFLGFSIIGHPYAGLMGTVVGLFHFVPVIGPWIAAAVAALLALFNSPLMALEAIIVSVVAQNLTDNLISPLVMRSAVKVHPVLSLIGIIVGETLGGVLGMALAIPLTAAIRSVFVYYFENKTNRQLVSYDGALFRSTPFKDEAGNILPAFDALDDDKFFENSLLVDTPEELSVIAEDRPDDLKPSVAEILEKQAKKIGDTQVLRVSKHKKRDE